MRHAIINKDNVVINVVLWDGKTKWTPPKGCQAIPTDKFTTIGDIYDQNLNIFSKTPIVPLK